MKSKNKSSKSSSKSGVKEKEKPASKVVANETMVEAIRASDQLKEEYASSLVKIGRIYTEEQMTRAELVASLMEARGIEKKSAESAASRVLGLINKPEKIKALEAGEITVRAALAGGNVRGAQKNPNKKKQAENIEKRFNRSLAELVKAAKEGAYERSDVLDSVRAALKDAGVK